MPVAPSFEKLFDFETNFEAAGQALLAATGVTAFISQQTQQLFRGRDVYTGIGLDMGPALDELMQLVAPPGWPDDHEPPAEFFRYDASFEFRIAVKRDKNQTPDPAVDSLMAWVRGRIRANMMMTCAPFNPTNLPYYRVSVVRPNGSSWGYEGARNVDFQNLRWAIRFAILKESFPVVPVV
jgi:hypothetical protein